MIVLRLERAEKMRIVEDVQSYLNDNLDCAIGQLAAENLFDYVLKQIGPIVYNEALRDARTVVSQQLERLDEELYAIEQPRADRKR